MCPTGAFRIAGREEDEMVELDAAQAVRLVVLHEEQAAPVVEQPAQVHSCSGSTTTRSGGWFVAARNRSALRAERSGETQCVR